MYLVSILMFWQRDWIVLANHQRSHQLWPGRQTGLVFQGGLDAGVTDNAHCFEGRHTVHTVSAEIAQSEVLRPQLAVEIDASVTRVVSPKARKWRTMADVHDQELTTHCTSSPVRAPRRCCI